MAAVAAVIAASSVANKEQVIYRIEPSDIRITSDTNSSQRSPASAQLTRVLKSSTTRSIVSKPLSSTSTAKDTHPLPVNEVKQEQEQEQEQPQMSLPLPPPAPPIYSVRLVNKLISEMSPPPPSPHLFESLLRQWVNKFPILVSDSLKKKMLRKHGAVVVRASNCSDCCLLSARSMHEYYSWPYGKRKACEWMRAVHLRRHCLGQLGNTSEPNAAEPAWSTKQVILWLRAHGYTPLEYKHMSLEHSEATPAPAPSSGYVDSLTPLESFDATVGSLLLQEETITGDGGDHHSASYSTTTTANIDIVSIVPDDLITKRSASSSHHLHHHHQIQQQQQQQILLRGDTGEPTRSNRPIEMCEGARYVSEQLDMARICSFSHISTR